MSFHLNPPDFCFFGRESSRRGERERCRSSVSDAMMDGVEHCARLFEVVCHASKLGKFVRAWTLGRFEARVFEWLL